MIFSDYREGLKLESFDHSYKHNHSTFSINLQFKKRPQGLKIYDHNVSV